MLWKLHDSWESLPKGTSDGIIFEKAWQPANAPAPGEQDRRNQRRLLHILALQLPGYISELGAKFLVTMRKPVKNRSYTKAKPSNTSEGVWVQELNDCILK